MSVESNGARGEVGLLANGTSPRWDVAVDESIGEGEYWADLEGPNVYLYCQLSRLSSVRRMLEFFKRRAAAAERGQAVRRGGEEDSLTLGKFAGAAVSLIGDDEDPWRCFLVVGARGKSSLRITFVQDDVTALIQALEQVVEDLPRESE